MADGKEQVFCGRVELGSWKLGVRRAQASREARPKPSAPDRPPQDRCEEGDQHYPNDHHTRSNDWILEGDDAEADHEGVLPQTENPVRERLWTGVRNCPRP